MSWGIKGGSIRLGAVLMGLLVVAGCGVVGPPATGGPTSGGSASKAPDSTATTDVDFPNGPVTILVGHSAGGSTDTVIRSLQPSLEKVLGVPVVIEIRKGGNGNTAMTFVSRAKPDGHTLVAAVHPSYEVNQQIQETGYDIREMTTIYNISGRDYNGLVAGAETGIKTFDELLKALAKPGLKAGTAGIGSNTFIAFALLKAQPGLENIGYVPYGGQSDKIAGLLGGHTGLSIGRLFGFDDIVKAGKANMLAILGPQRDPQYPDVPTMDELGFTGVDFDSAVGVLAPPGMDPAVVEKLAAAVKTAMNSDDFKARAEKAGFQPTPLGPKEYRAQLEVNYATGKTLSPIIKKIQDEEKNK